MTAKPARKLERTKARKTPRTQPRPAAADGAAPDVRFRDLGALAVGRKGSKQGSSGAYDAPNTLRSNAVVRFLDMLSEGPIGGLVNGAQSIYFNNVPVLADDGRTYNFRGVNYLTREGYPDQETMAGFPSGSSVVNVATQCFYQNPVVRAVQSLTANALVLTLQIPSLSKTNIQNGDTTETSLSFTVDYHDASGAWQQAYNQEITGKCTSPYEFSLRVNLVGTAPFSVRVTRTSVDSIIPEVQDALFLENINEVTDHQLIYPDTAYVGVEVDAMTFGSTVPTRSYDVNGILLRVPANFDTATRQYRTVGQGTTGGVWDGVTWELWPGGNDPAWIFYDLISNARYGVGLPEQAIEALRWDLYEISQYCNTSIPDGFGGFEPRFVCNVAITTQDDAYAVLGNLASVFMGMTYWGGGQLIASADMPANPVKLVSQANVLNGSFSYEGTALRARHSVAQVQWMDPADNYRLAIELVEDPAMIQLVGVQLAQATAFGCLSRGQAHRVGKWLLDSERHATEIVTYQAVLDQLDVRPGEIIAVADADYAGIRLSGRVWEGSTPTTIVLDQPPPSIPGANAVAISVTYPDASTGLNMLIASYSLDPGGRAVCNLASPQPQVPVANAIWIITASDLAPRQFRVLSVTEPEVGVVEVTALEHDPTKYARVELGIQLATTPFSILPNYTTSPLTPPSNVSAIGYLTGVGTTTVARITVSWTQAYDPRVAGYVIQVVNDVGLNQLIKVSGGISSYDIDNLAVANYGIQVASRSMDGRQSAYVSAPSFSLTGLSGQPAAVVGLTAVGGVRQVALSWTANTERSMFRYEVWRSPQLTPGPGAAGSNAVFLAFVGGTAYVDADYHAMLPGSTWHYWVRAQTTTLVEGPFAGPVSATLSLLVAADLQDGILNAAKFASSLAPVGLVTQLPTSLAQVGGAQVIFNETDSKLYRYAGPDALGAPIWTAAVPAPDVAGKLSASQIQSLATAQLSGQIVASQIAAGAVTTAALAVSGGANWIWNPNLSNTYDGWQFATTSGTLAYCGDTISLAAANASFAPYVLQTDGSGFLSVVQGLPAGQYMAATWDPDTLFGGTGLPGFPVGPGDVVQGQAQLVTHSCAGFVSVWFYDGNNAIVGQFNGNRVYNNVPTGAALYAYKQSFVTATAPATAVRARLLVVGANDGGADIENAAAGPQVVFTHTLLGPGVPNATAAGPWSPGGLTSVSGGVIKTNTLNANRIVAGSITSDKIAANAIVAGKIQAGAINSNEIAAGVIRTGMLASDFQLTQASQIGTAVIGTAQIGDAVITHAKIGGLEVQTQNINSNAVSDIATGYGYGSIAVDFTVSSSPSTVTFIAHTSGTETVGTNQNNMQANYVSLTDPGGTLLSKDIKMILYVQSLNAGSYRYTCNTLSGAITMIVLIQKK